MPHSSIRLACVFIFLTAAPAPAQTTGTISGTLTLFENGFGAPGEILPSIEIYDGNGVLTKTVALGIVAPSLSVMATVPWTAFGVAPGKYYIRTSNPVVPPSSNHPAPTSGFWVDQLYGGGVCVAVDCNPLNGTPVAVTGGQTTSGIDFTLDIGASISGSGERTTFLATEGFDIFDSRGVLLPNRIASFGVPTGYVAAGLPAGTYYLLAHRATDNSAPETLYPNIPCDGCAVTSGTPITVALGDTKTGLDFGTPASGGISGTVRSDGSGNPPNSPLSGVIVTVYALNGTALTSATTASDGTYSIAALALGPYFLSTSNALGFVDQLYNNAGCGGCSPVTGTAVTVSGGSTTTGIDFSLTPGVVLLGIIASSPLTNALLDPRVRLYASSPGAPAALVAPVFIPNPSPVGTVFFSATVPQGSYYVQTDPIAGFTEQIYSAIACPQGDCKTTFAAPVTVGASMLSGINFTLQPCTASTIAPVSLANAAVGIAYRQTLLATGSNGAVGWVVSSGTLPPGLTIDPNSGVLSGTPTTSGRFTFTVSAVDSIACAGSRTYTLDVPACTFPGPSTLSVPAAGVPVPDVPTGTLIYQTCEAAGWSSTIDVPWMRGGKVPVLHMAPDGTTLHWAIAITVDPNTSTILRTGHVAYGSHSMTVVQSGTATSAPFGVVDVPANGEVVAGSMAVSGWALDDVGVSQVQIYRDPVAGEGSGQIFIGSATFVSGSRPDVQAAYRSAPFNARAGWGYLLLTNMLPNQGNGVFNLYAYATDVDGNRTLLGARTITAVNRTATAPFGAIDTPDQGGTISGSAFVNFGWALTPQPKLIPTDGSTIDVLIDGVNIGTVNAYNFFRSDVSGLFPELKNSGGPVGYRVIDTTALSEGLHTIAWMATDDQGVSTGIGSRFFTVQNSAWEPSLRANFAATPPALTDTEIAHADATTAIPARVDGLHLGRKVESLSSLASDSARTVSISNLQSLKLRLNTSGAGQGISSGANGCAPTYAGYLVANGELAALPVGSSLDPAGTFYWQPGTAFFGTYQLLFVRTSCHGTQQRIPVSVSIH